MKKSKEANQTDLAENIERYLNIIDEVEFWVLKYCYGIRRTKDIRPYHPAGRYKDPYLVTKDELAWLKKFYLMFNLDKDDHKVIDDAHIILSELSSNSAYEKYRNEDTFKQNSHILRHIERYMQRILKDITLHTSNKLN
ncbi:MAG: hypothetical protein JXA96_00475 [Sedimentisphaerales bacterium]|nr:hypothetical protein [Sedimentisphaerales bacterium]